MFSYKWMRYYSIVKEVYESFNKIRQEKAAVKQRLSIIIIFIDFFLGILSVFFSLFNLFILWALYVMTALEYDRFV
jgi:hypothetical protein